MQFMGSQDPASSLSSRGGVFGGSKRLGEEPGFPWSLYLNQGELNYKTFLPVPQRKDKFSLRFQIHSIVGVSKECGNPSQVMQMIRGFKTVQNSGGGEGGRQRRASLAMLGTG